MISHEYKCIFIHISRTAGTSMEQTICGKNWWEIDKNTKHITANKAKELYKDYWDSYFKFSFVRNPWDRIISCYHHMWYKNTHKDQDLEYMLNNFKTPPWEQDGILEYVDILGDELNFIGRYENLLDDFNFVKQKIGLNKQLSHMGKGDRDKNYQKYYTDKSITLVENMYKKSIEKFNYTF